MKKGILKTIILYGLGFALAGFVYLIFGYSYIHAPGFHHWIIFLTLIVGIFWTLFILFSFVRKGRTERRKGILLTSSLILLSCFSYVAVTIYIEKENNFSGATDVISTKVKGDTTFISHNGNTVFIKVKDSVLLDLK